MAAAAGPAVRCSLWQRRSLRCGPGTGSAPLPARPSGRPAPRAGACPSRHRCLSAGPRPVPGGGAPLRLCSTQAVPQAGINKPVIDRIIRVDHAGEFGANRIYAGQMAVLGRSSVGPVIQQMWNQEKDHLKKFNELMVAYRVRPTVLLPFWNVAGFVLGAGSALLGKKGAMACTVAVEESISEHYNNQIRTLIEEDPEKYKELLQVIKQFRDEEQEHHDIGLEHDAEATPAYSVLKTAIQLGCKAAIFLSERI
uniref:5-demethoxyubiquinone hydroxylase, mitochondrial n=1 Tax=Ficedula albicollis TaxID=59894 RepID=A0A803W9C7_FICAL